MYKAIRKSSRNKPEEMVVETENGITIEDMSTKIVTPWFEKAFKAVNQTEYPEVTPKDMNDYSQEMK